MSVRGDSEVRHRRLKLIDIGVTLACAAGGVLWVVVTGFGVHSGCPQEAQPPGIHPIARACGYQLHWGWLIIGLVVGLVSGFAVVAGITLNDRLRRPS